MMVRDRERVPQTRVWLLAQREVRRAGRRAAERRQRGGGGGSAGQAVGAAGDVFAGTPMTSIVAHAPRPACLREPAARPQFASFGRLLRRRTMSCCAPKSTAPIGCAAGPPRRRHLRRRCSSPPPAAQLAPLQADASSHAASAPCQPCTPLSDPVPPLARSPAGRPPQLPLPPPTPPPPPASRWATMPRSRHLCRTTMARSARVCLTAFVAAEIKQRVATLHLCMRAGSSRRRTSAR